MENSSVPLLVVLLLLTATPALAQTSWGVAVTPGNDVVFCDLRRDRVWKLDREGDLNVLLPRTHCHALVYAGDGFIYGEDVNAGTHIDASAGVSRDTSLGVWRVGLSGTLQWLQPPSSAPDPSAWLVMDRDRRSYGWSGMLPQSKFSQILRHDAAGLAIAVAGNLWGQQDGNGISARLGRVAGLAFAADGTLLIVDSGNVRRMTPPAQIRTESVGTVSDSIEGVVAHQGLWDRTVGVAADADGSAVVVDNPSGRVIRVGRDGRAHEIWRSHGLVNWLTGSRWGWRPTGVAVLQSGFYVMEDWAMPAIAADLVGVPRVLHVKADGSYERVVSVGSWFERTLVLLGLVIVGSALRFRRGRPR